MGPVSAQLFDEFGYDPDDGVPQLSGLRGDLSLGDLSDDLSLSGDLSLGGDLSLSRDLSLSDDLPLGQGGVRGVRSAGRGLAAGTVIAARIGARRVAVARLGSGRLVVVADECPHDGGRISDGFVDGERLICARHGWELEARNGRCERACKLRE